MRYVVFPRIPAMLLAMVASAARAEDQSKALDEIASFAERVCQTAPVKSSSEELELSGKANADLKALIARIAGLGINGAVKYKKDHSEGVLQKDLAPLLSQGGKCKESISNKLIDKLIVNAQTSPPASTLHTDRPNQAGALAQIRDAMTKVNNTLGSDTLLSFGNFRYGNGYQEDANHYVVVVTYQLVFKVGLRDMENMAGKDLGGGIEVLVFAFRYGQFSAGDWFDEARSYRFLRTENGWLIQELVGDPSVLASHVKPRPPAAEATNQGPHPFTPNSVLNRDYPWSGGCIAPKGTRIMDLGRDKALPDYESIVIDPAVCPPRSGVATAGIAPPDVLEPIRNP